MKTPLFIFWEDRPGKRRPPYIDPCKQTFIKHCSADFDLQIVNSSSPIVPEMPKAWYTLPKLCQKADVLRVFLVEKYGGIWFDIDTIMVRSPLPIIEPIDKGKCEFTYFKFAKLSPGIPLNGFFGARRNSSIMAMWKEEIMRRISKPNPSNWEFGQLSLAEVMKKSNRGAMELPLNWVYQLEDRDDYFKLGQGIHYELLRKNLSINDIVKPHTIGVSLYNDMYNESPIIRKEFDVVNMTEKQFMSSGVLAAQIIKKALQ